MLRTSWIEYVISRPALLGRASEMSSCVPAPPSLFYVLPPSLLPPSLTQPRVRTPRRLPQDELLATVQRICFTAKAAAFFCKGLHDKPEAVRTLLDVIFSTFVRMIVQGAEKNVHFLRPALQLKITPNFFL